jgi:hypothetical protein
MLGPLPEDVDILDYLIATGEATPPTGDLLDLPLPRSSEGPSTSEILGELREERI